MARFEHEGKIRENGKISTVECETFRVACAHGDGDTYSGTDTCAGEKIA